MHDIKLTAYNGDTEPGRIARLEAVKGYVWALAEQSGNADLLDKIERMHDHKGDLTVYWKRMPTPVEKEILKKAWSSRVGDMGWGTVRNVVVVTFTTEI